MVHFTDQLIAEYNNILTESYKSPYLGKCDPLLAKNFYHSLKQSILDLETFHKTFDDEIENIGLMSVFADDGALAHRGTWGPIKNYSDQTNPAIIGLKKLWTAQFIDNLKPSTNSSTTNNTQNSTNGTSPTTSNDLLAEAKAREAEVIALLDQGLYQKLQSLAAKVKDAAFGNLYFKITNKLTNKPVIGVTISSGSSKKIQTILKFNILTNHWPDHPAFFDTFDATKLAADLNKNLPDYIAAAEDLVNYLEFLERPEVTQMHMVATSRIATFIYNVNNTKQSITVDASGIRSWDIKDYPIILNLDLLPLPSSARLVARMIKTNICTYVSAKLSAFTDAELTQYGWEDGAVNPVKSTGSGRYQSKGPAGTFTEIRRQEAKDTCLTGNLEFSYDHFYYTEDGFDFWGKFE